MTTVPPKSPTPELFDRSGIAVEGHVVPSRAAAIINHYGATHGVSHRLAFSDIMEIHRAGLFPEGIPTPNGRFWFTASEILTWLDQGKLQCAIKHLECVADAKREKSEQDRVKSHIQQCLARDQALEICQSLMDGGSFEKDLQAAVSSVVKKHYEQIPNTVAKIIASEISGSVRLSEAVEAYGGEFTGRILDKLADSWIKRILAKDHSPVDRSKIDKALGYVAGIRSSGSVIYILKASGIRAVKIGIAADLQSRIGGIQTGSPFPVKCLLAFHGSRTVEESLHHLFREIRLSGEWFVLDSTMKQFIVEGRSKINKLVSGASSKVAIKKAQRHIDLIRRWEPEEDELSSIFGASLHDAWRLAEQANRAIEDRESAPREESPAA